MAGEALRRRRGPKPNPDRGVPSGYRVTVRTRFELQVAAAFVGKRTLQETVDLAVTDFLQRMHEVVGFDDALRNAEAHQQERAKLPRIPEP